MASLQGCRERPDPEVAGGSAQLVLAIQRLRDAPRSDKRGHLTQLNATPCAGALPCETKRVCVIAYAKHLSAIDTIARVKGMLRETEERDSKDDDQDGGKNGAPETHTGDNDAARLLLGGEAALAHASQLTAACADHEATLRRELGL